MDAVIIDDAQSAIDNLVEKLKQYADINVVATSKSGTEGLNLIDTYKPQLLFLDIELPDMTGLEVLEKMNEKEADNWCYVVMYTAYNDYMLPAFRNKAFDFLLKPIDEKELCTIMQRFYIELANSKSGFKADEVKDDILKPHNGKLLFYTNAVDFRIVQLRDICVFYYDHDLRSWTVIAAGCSKPMRLKRNVNKEILLKLDNRFIQISQKCIINLNYLFEVRDNICYFYPPFDNITDVKVGRFFRRKLISRYNSL